MGGQDSTDVREEVWRLSDITVGPWQRDEDGHWYRMFGNTKEYRPEMMTSTGTAYADQIREHNKRIQAQEERERIQAEAERIQRDRLPFCPFRARESRMESNARCTAAGCAWYDGQGCRMISGTQGDGVGATCPISGRACRRECVAYAADGCRMIKTEVIR